ncbi:MAG: hypothetical protein NT027_13935 [Proteobacteria bacterium]|nr:hypothetical protein [Pseudomonadota bacterium]
MKQQLRFTSEIGPRCFCILLVTYLSLFNSSVYACASCGSGGDDPLILFPWETWKAHLGFARVSDFELIDQKGETGYEFGPESRNTTIVSFGRAITNRSFVTLTAPYIVNQRRERQMSGWGDPMVAVRYTMLQQSLENESIPQVQFIASYRTGDAVSVYETADPARLDVRGSGVPEARVGIDLWSAMKSIKYGAAQTVTTPVGSKDSEIGDVKPGVAFRTTLTTGYGWGDQGKVLCGVNREYSFKKSLNGQPLEDSEMLAHTAFLSADAMVQRNTNVRFTFAKSLGLLDHRNVSKSQTLTMAVQRSL